MFALFALQRGLINQAQLLAAFETWVHAPERTMADILGGQDVIGRSGCELLDKLVADHLEHDRTRLADKKEVSATVAYIPPDDRAGDGRTVSSARRAASPAPTERFVVVRPYASGGLGQVFVALEPELDRQVALKELQSAHAFDPISQSRFLLEARVTGRLEHPGIVPVYGIGRYADGRPYYAMRFIEGETLRQAIERFHARPAADQDAGKTEIAFRRLLRSLIDACNAVAYAHSRGVVHRDLKPENIMLGRFGETLVVDWGIAKPLVESDGESNSEPSPTAQTDDSSLTRPGSALGTPQYMSPEQAAGETDRVGPASDIYGLGATLYCLLVGHGPFTSGNMADVLQQVRRGIFPAPRRLRRTIDPVLEAICLRAMALEPSDRYENPLQLAGAIEAWLADVRYRGEHEQAHRDVRRSLARLCIERAHNLFERDMRGDGMLWLARALESIPDDSLGLARAVRSSLGGWRPDIKLAERSLHHKGAVCAAVFSDDGRRLATACSDGTAQLWDVAKGTPLASPMTQKAAVRAIAFSRDGRLAVTAGDDGTMLRWDALTGSAVGRPCRHDGPVTIARFSPDGSKIATASRANVPCLWDTQSGKPIGAKTANDSQVFAVAFNPSGSLVAAACEDGQVTLWETKLGKRAGETLRHESAVLDLAFSPDGRTLLTACRDGQAQLWDLEMRAPIFELAHRAPVGVIAFRPDGCALAAASHDGTARLWDAKTGRPIGEPLSHRARIECLAFNHEGTILATGGQDETVRLWDAGFGLPIGPALPHRGSVTGVAFSPDGRRLATASVDFQARLWRVPAPVAGDAERIACWVRVAIALEFDDGDAIRPIDQLVLWELRRRLQELGGAPAK
jgi:WD40 repeat protein/serine/threonine protein kinase